MRRPVRDREDQGASAVEYGLLVAAIAMVIVGVVFGLGQVINKAFHDTCSAIAVSASQDSGCILTPSPTSGSGTTDPATAGGSDPATATDQPVPASTDQPAP